MLQITTKSPIMYKYFKVLGAELIFKLSTFVRLCHKRKKKKIKSRKSLLTREACRGRYGSRTTLRSAIFLHKGRIHGTLSSHRPHGACSTRKIWPTLTSCNGSILLKWSPRSLQLTMYVYVHEIYQGTDMHTKYNIIQQN